MGSIQALQVAWKTKFISHVLQLVSRYVVIWVVYLDDDSLSRVAKKRKFTRWSKQDAELVIKHFMAWVSSSASTSLPLKPDILAFKTKYPNVPHDWETVRNKVLNEKMAYAKRKQRKLDELKP